jgi:hypothetical protein
VDGKEKERNMKKDLEQQNEGRVKVRTACVCQDLL